MKLARGEASQLLTDPLFRSGYLEALRCGERLISSAWSTDEVRAYIAGHGFGTWCWTHSFRPRLTRSGVADAEAAALLLRCSLSGALGVAA